MQQMQALRGDSTIVQHMLHIDIGISYVKIIACIISYPLSNTRLLLTGCSDESACQTDAQKIEKNDLKISSNEAYGVTLNSDGGAEEIIYNYTQMNIDGTIEAKQNEAYATNIVTQGNEAYTAASIAL